MRMPSTFFIGPRSLSQLRLRVIVRDVAFGMKSYEETRDEKAADANLKPRVDRP